MFEIIHSNFVFNIDVLHLKIEKLFEHLIIMHDMSDLNDIQRQSSSK